MVVVVVCVIMNLLVRYIPNMWNSSLICDLFGIWIMKFFEEYEIYKLFQENVGGKIYKLFTNFLGNTKFTNFLDND